MKCVDCGIERPTLHKHHIIPRIDGGPNDPSNLVPLCANCHEDRHGGPCGGALRGVRSPEGERKRIKALRKLWDDPEFRKKRNADLTAAAHTPEVKAKRSASVRRAWSDPEYKRRQAESRKAAWESGRRKPNRTGPNTPEYWTPERREEKARKLREAHAKHPEAWAGVAEKSSARMKARWAAKRDLMVKAMSCK